jgi:hypothetical protein
MQCEEFLSKGETDDLGALLVKAGEFLSPDDFALAMDGSPVPRDPSILLIPGSDYSQTETAAEAMKNIDSVALAANAGNYSQMTVQTEVTVEVLEPEVISVLIDKGKMLMQHRAVGQHAKKYLSNLGSGDVVRRCDIL